MATTEGISTTANSTGDMAIGKRKRESTDAGQEDRLVNGSATNNPEQALESFHDLLQDLVEVLSEFSIASTVLNFNIQSTSSKERTPKRAKTSSKMTTILSQVESRAYNHVDSFYEDFQLALRSIRTESDTDISLQAVQKLEQEVVSILNNELENSTIAIPRAEDRSALLAASSEEISSLATDANLVLTTPGFVYGLSQASKRLYSSFRTSSEDGTKVLQVLPLEKLPNNITASTTKIEKIGQTQQKEMVLKDLFQQTRHTPADPPRPSSSYLAKGSSITWTTAEQQKKPRRSRDRQNYYDQNLITGQWLDYNTPPSTSDLPSADLRRKQRHRALSLGEANVEFTASEKEAIRQAQKTYQQAKTDSLFKSIYSSFAPSHDNSGALIPNEVKSRYWWIKQGASKYLRVGTSEAHSPLNVSAEDGVQTDGDATSSAADTFEDVLESWIDPELLNALPKEKDDTEKEAAEILDEISDMLQILSSYQRNRSLTLNKQQGLSMQNKSVVDLLGDPSTPSGSEQLLYETLKESLASLITTLPPYAVAKLDGNQLGELNISTKMLVKESVFRGTSISADVQTPQQSAPVAARPPPAAVPARVVGPSQVATPTPAGSLARPAPGLYSKYRPGPGTSSYAHAQSPATPQHTASRPAYSYQPPAVAPMTNGTRSIPNGYSSYSSPQRPNSSSLARPTKPAVGQTYSNYNINNVNANSGRSASPQQAAAGQGQRANWNPSNGTIGSMFSAEEAVRLEERQKAQMAAQAAQLRQGSGTPRPQGQGMSPGSNGTSGQ